MEEENVQMEDALDRIAWPHIVSADGNSVQRGTHVVVDDEESDGIEVDIEIDSEREQTEDIQSNEIDNMDDISVAEDTADILSETPVATGRHDVPFAEARTGATEAAAQRADGKRIDHEEHVDISEIEEDLVDEDAPIEIDVITKCAEEVENVSELCMSLSACQLGTTLALNKRTIRRAAQSSKTIDSKWQSKYLWPQLSDINENNIQAGLYKLVQVNSPEARLCCVTGMGWELEGGTVELGRTGGIIFDSSCDNGVVNGVIFREGLIACYGSGCAVTFTNVEFDRCCVVALKGAQVKLDGCRFPLSVVSPEGIAVFAHGSGTSVSMKNCSILGGVQGVACHAGAKLEVSNLKVKRTQVTGIEVKDKGSSLELMESTFEDFSDQFSDKMSVVGALVHCNGRAYVRNMSVKQIAFGVAVLSSGHADIVDSTISETQWNCVSFGRASTGSVTSCTMSGSYKASGLHISGEGTSVDGKDCNFMLSRNAGVFILNQAILKLDGCESNSNKVAGYKVKKQATLALVNCTSDGDRLGCHASEKGQLSARDTSFKESVGTGICVHDGGSSSLLGCSVVESSEIGIDVRGPRSEAVIVDCTISGAQTACAVFVQGARGQIKSSTLSKAKELHGILCDGKGTGVEMEEVKLIENGISGVMAGDGAVMKLKKCVSEGNQSSGYCVQKKADMEVTECSSSGDKQGFKVYKGGRMKAVKAEINEPVERGAYVSEGGIAEFRECTITQAGSVGVEVKYQKSNLFMTKCVVASPETSGVAVSQGGTVQMDDCELSKARTLGLDVSGIDTEAHAKNCQFVANEQGGAAAREQGTASLTLCISEGNSVAGFTARELGVLNMVDCISKSDKVGCRTLTEGWLSGKGVTVEDCAGHGLRVWEAGAGEISGCKFLSCRSHGIDVKDLNSKVYMKDSAVVRPKLGCVVVSKGAQGTFHGCEFSQAESGHGVEISGKGTVLELSGCTIKENSKAGVFVSDRASITLTECVTQGHKIAGYEVKGRGAILRLEKSISDGDKIGCLASKEGKVFANEATLRNNIICGLSVANAGKSELQGCTIEGCGANGVEVTNIRSFLKMGACTVTGSGRACVLVSEMAKGELHGCVLAKAQKLHGAEIVGDGTEITMSECRFEENRQVGAFAGDSSFMNLSSCKSTGNKIAGYESRGGATMTLNECSSDRFLQKGSLTRSAKVETLKNARR